MSAARRERLFYLLRERRYLAKLMVFVEIEDMAIIGQYEHIVFIGEVRYVLIGQLADSQRMEIHLIDIPAAVLL